MIKRIKWIGLVLVWGLIFGEGFAQAPNWEWAKGAGGTDEEKSKSIAVDGNGNTFITGYFYSDSIFFGSITLSNAGGSDIFIAKYNAAGVLLWAKSIGGPNEEWGFGVSVDSIGNSYITGFFQSPTITFDSFTLMNTGISDIFLAKYDTWGNVIWAKSAGGHGDDYGRSISVDANGNSYLTGDFYSDTITFSNITLVTTNGGPNIFVAKYDSSGNVKWAESAGGAVSWSISVGANGNSFITGWFQSPTLTFDSITLINLTGTEDIFIAKYDSSGNVIWANHAGGSSYDRGYSIATDALGNSYITGAFESPSLIFGIDTLMNAGDYDVFAVKYDSSGNVLWARNIGGTSQDEGYGISVDPNGNSYITGEFWSSAITFGITLLNNTTNFSSDIFVAKYDTWGNAVYAKSASGTASDFSNSICVDANKNSYITGFFPSFPLSFGNISLTNSGSYDIFVAKLGNTTDIPEQTNSLNPINISPNPATSTIQLTFNTKHNGAVRCDIINMVGKTVYEAPLPASPRRGEGSYAVLDVSFLAKGIYVVRVGDGEQWENRKLVVE